MAGSLLQEETFLGGYWVKNWPRVNGEWELRDSEGLAMTFDTEQEMLDYREKVVMAYRMSERYRAAFDQKFGTD
jgi:hypothetical protein